MIHQRCNRVLLLGRCCFTPFHPTNQPAIQPSFSPSCTHQSLHSSFHATFWNTTSAFFTYHPQKILLLVLLLLSDEWMNGFVLQQHLDRHPPPVMFTPSPQQASKHIFLPSAADSELESQWVTPVSAQPIAVRVNRKERGLRIGDDDHQQWRYCCSYSFCFLEM